MLLEGSEQRDRKKHGAESTAYSADVLYIVVYTEARIYIVKMMK
jgi:hypothetical protein